MEEREDEGWFVYIWDQLAGVSHLPNAGLSLSLSPELSLPSPLPSISILSLFSFFALSHTLFLSLHFILFTHSYFTLTPQKMDHDQQFALLGSAMSLIKYHSSR